MDAFLGLLQGLTIALSPENIGFAAIGCIVGMLVGVLPGIGQSTGMALLIPITFALPPAGAIIMLASIYYGAAYGGTITSILMNVPGESETVVTTFDGYPMAQQGRAGAALSIAAIGSFLGGTFSTILLALSALTISRLALLMGPAENFALMLLGLTLAVGLIGDNLVKGLIMVVAGLLLSQVGMDPQLGIPRLTFGQIGLLDGIPLLCVIMGLFGLSDVLLSVFDRPKMLEQRAAIGRIFPTRGDLRQSAAPIGRGAIIGFVLGVIPGMVSAVSTFASYIVERRVSRTPERFGKGAIEGVAGPETANNAFANAAFLPLLTLGIPTSAALAILFGAFTIHGLAPGPLLFRDSPDIAWGLVASMIVGNAILVVLNIPLLRLWVQILRVPWPFLAAIIVSVSAIGVYSINNSAFDVMVLAVFGIAGAALKRANFPLAPLVLAFILGDKIENTLRQSLTLAQGNWSVFVTRPIAATLLAIAVIVLVSAAWRMRSRKV